MRFDAALASTSAEDFIEKILAGALGIGGAAIGFDFHFGKNRTGSPEFLTEQGRRLGFAVDVVPPLEDEGRPVSSGAVRAALAAGRVVEATELLGAPWFVSGEVIHGDKRGRELGFPTANLKLDPACGLKHGIYAVRVDIAGVRHDGVASFGRRPMFDDGAPLLEVYLFDFDDDLYGQRHRCRLHRMDPAGAEVRIDRDAQAPHDRGRRPGPRRAQARGQGLPAAG